MAINLDRIGAVVERYMLDTVRVVRRDDSAVTINPSTLAATYTEALIYEGKAMVAALGAPAGTQLGGNVPLARVTYEVALPLGNYTVQPNDDLVITKSRDPQLVGRKLRITGSIPTSLVTHRRLSAVLDTDAQ